MKRARLFAAVCSLAVGAGCPRELSGPSPAASGSVPASACNEQRTTEVVISGSGFAPLPTDALGDAPRLVLPAVTLVRTVDASGAPAPARVAVPDDPAAPAASHVRWRDAQTLAFDVFEELRLPPGLYDVEIANRTGSRATSPGALLVVPRPSVTLLEPELLCTANGGALRVEGDWFVRTGDALPVLTLGERTFAAAEAHDCRALPGAAGAQACRVLVVPVPADALAAGPADARVTNPDPAGCHSTEAVHLTMVPPPQVSAVAPASLCTTTGGRLRIRGDFFLRRAALEPPAVAVGAANFAPASMDDCRAVEGLDGAQFCRLLQVDVPADALGAGPLDLTVTNPAPADCSSDPAMPVLVVPPPTIAGVLPSKICAGGGHLRVRGTGFVDGTTVAVGALGASTVQVDSSTDVGASFGAGLDTGGPYDLAVTLPQGCGAVLPAAVRVVSGPQLFFVDPPVVYGELSLQLTAWGSGLPDLASVKLVGPAGMQTLSSHFDPQHPARLLVDLPAPQADGAYALEIADTTGCTSTLPGALRVVSSTTLATPVPEPRFGWTGEATGLTVFLAPVAGGGFRSLPRLYLSGTGGTAPQAAALASVAMLGPDRVTAVVPAGLAPGAFDLVVVNPDGGLGLAPAAFTVTNHPAPVVDSASPGSVPNSDTAQPLRVVGRNFRQPALRLDCRAPGAAAATPVGTSITASSSTSVDATFDATSSVFTGGAACVVVVTNTDEGSFARFSALAVTNPAENLPSPASGPPLGAARRGPSLAAARLDNAARFLFALGGDDGTDAGARASVESTPVDVLGAPGGWTAQRHALASPRAFGAAAALGRFVYAVGGFDGTQALASVERAALLDTSARPEITDLDVLAGTQGLGPGVWYYRVSAVLDGTDPFNPGGETLASERFPISLPALPGGRLARLVVRWSSVPRAVSYRVYRNAAGTDAAGLERLVGTVAADGPRELADAGLAPGADEPLPLGSLGTWHAVAPLGTARRGHAAVVVADPAGADLHHLYVFGGRGTSGSVLQSWERLALRLESDGRQSATGPWLAGATALPAGRQHLRAVAASSATTARVPAGETWLWVGPGQTETGGAAAAVDAAQVLPGGALAPFRSVKALNGRAGYGFVLAGSFLYAFGGGGPADQTAVQGELCAPGVSGCNATSFPEVRNWNSAGIALTRGRYLTAALPEGATIYLVGGATADGATASTEQVTW